MVATCARPKQLAVETTASACRAASDELFGGAKPRTDASTKYLRIEVVEFTLTVARVGIALSPNTPSRPLQACRPLLETSTWGVGAAPDLIELQIIGAMLDLGTISNLATPELVAPCTNTSRP